MMKIYKGNHENPLLSLPTSASTEKKTLEGREVGLLIELVREVDVETETRAMKDMVGFCSQDLGEGPAALLEVDLLEFLRQGVMFAAEWLGREGQCPQSLQRQYI